MVIPRATKSGGNINEALELGSLDHGRYPEMENTFLVLEAGVETTDSNDYRKRASARRARDALLKNATAAEESTPWPEPFYKDRRCELHWRLLAALVIGSVAVGSLLIYCGVSALMHKVRGMPYTYNVTHFEAPLSPNGEYQLAYWGRRMVLMSANGSIGTVLCQGGGKFIPHLIDLPYGEKYTLISCNAICFLRHCMFFKDGVSNRVDLPWGFEFVLPLKGDITRPHNQILARTSVGSEDEPSPSWTYGLFDLNQTGIQQLYNVTMPHVHVGASIKSVSQRTSGHINFDIIIYRDGELLVCTLRRVRFTYAAFLEMKNECHEKRIAAEEDCGVDVNYIQESYMLISVKELTPEGTSVRQYYFGGHEGVQQELDWMTAAAPEAVATTMLDSFQAITCAVLNATALACMWPELG